MKNPLTSNTTVYVTCLKRGENRTIAMKQFSVYFKDHRGEYWYGRVYGLNQDCFTARRIKSPCLFARHMLNKPRHELQSEQGHQPFTERTEKKDELDRNTKDIA